jgi:hypothetical protein
LNYDSTLILLARYLCWWTISPRGIIRPVVSASALTWFIRYIYYWNLQFLNNVNVNKTKVLLPQVKQILAILFRFFGFIAPKIFNYMAFQSFDFERTWWRLFQKYVVGIKFDIYFFVSAFLLVVLQLYICFLQITMNTNEYSKTGNEGLVSNEDRFNLSRKIFVGNISYRVIVLYMLYIVKTIECLLSIGIY